MSVSGFFLVISLTSVVYAAGVNLAWNAPTTGGEVKGYNLYYGNAVGNYPNKVAGIADTEYIVSGLDEEKVYYFVVKAFNDAGESGPSNVIIWRDSDSTPPLPPIGIQVQ